ncbi:MAG TPA: HlyD family efflux transporter periplasmic adaptor subunit [Clostridia bacterium]|nr:HlyD family efflux transporter periplasmic adaptor subunit [Clostridia bacterium]
MKKKKLWVLIIAILLVSSLVLVVFSNQGEALEVTGVKRGEIKKYVEDIGTVKCKEQISVSLEGGGLIQTLAAETGQQVKKGELLLGMDKQQLELQLKDIGEKIKEIEASFQGSEIKNYASNIEKAGIAVGRAKDEYELALKDYDNAKRLAEAGAISSEELRQKEAALKSAEALMNTAQIELQQLEANTPDSVKAVYNAQLGQLLVAREGILRSIKKQEAVAPIDGVVLERNAEVNTVGIPGTVAFVIGNVDNAEIEAGILADDVADIKLGDEVEITERSEKKQTIKGTVVKIAPSAIGVTSSLGVNQKRVSITVQPEKQSGVLKPGYEVDVRIITERKSGILLVPLSSVFEYEGTDQVFAVVDGKAVLRTVRKGIKGEDSVEILEGLEEGELILSEPDVDVREGMRIKPPKNVE